MKHNLLKFTGIFALGLVVASSAIFLTFGSLWKYRQLDSVLKEASAKKYDLNTYNCINFSEDAQKRLEDNNIASNVIVVKKNDIETHALVSVWFDAENGTFAPKTDLLGDYNELKNKFGWADH